MILNLKKIFFLSAITLILLPAHANDPDRKIPHISLPDSTNIYKNLLSDESDDLMENHPAADLYNNIWTSSKLNPYKIPIDSLPDSVRIDLTDFRLPTPGHITSHFGPRRYRFHYGTDIKLYTGDSVAAAFTGKIRIIDYDRGGYGHYVVIRHNNGLETVYAHLSRVLVSLDQDVNSGDIIALGGNTGRSTGSHLHFEMRILGNAINPAKIIDFSCGNVFAQEYIVTKKESFYYQKQIKQMAAAKYYRIRSGDTLGHIARRNGTSVNALCRLNKIKATKVLRIGQTIRVR